jgi:hypothetical protein
MLLVLSALLLLLLLLLLDKSLTVTEKDVCLDALGQWDGPTQNCKLKAAPASHM